MVKSFTGAPGSSQGVLLAMTLKEFRKSRSHHVQRSWLWMSSWISCVLEAPVKKI